MKLRISVTLSPGHFLSFTGIFLASEISEASEIIPVLLCQVGGRDMWKLNVSFGSFSGCFLLSWGEERPRTVWSYLLFFTLIGLNKIYQPFLYRPCANTYSKPALFWGQAGTCWQVGYRNIPQLSVSDSFHTTMVFPTNPSCTSEMSGISAHTRILFTSLSLKSLIPCALFAFPSDSVKLFRKPRFAARWFACPGLSGNETIASLCFENRSQNVLVAAPLTGSNHLILQRTLSLLMLWVWHQVMLWERVRLIVLLRAFLKRLIILLIWGFSHNMETWTNL